MSFPEFYQSGGFFMHAISLTAIAAVAGIAMRARAVRRVLNRPADERGNGAALGSAAAPWVVVAIVVFGALGSAMGWIELMAAIQTVPGPQQRLAFARGGQFMMAPLAWSLMLAAPIVLCHAVLARFEHRVRSALQR